MFRHKRLTKKIDQNQTRFFSILLPFFLFSIVQTAKANRSPFALTRGTGSGLELNHNWFCCVYLWYSEHLSWKDIMSITPGFNRGSGKSESPKAPTGRNKTENVIPLYRPVGARVVWWCYLPRLKPGVIDIMSLRDSH